MSEEYDKSKFGKQDTRRYACFNCKNLESSVLPNDKEERPIIKCKFASFGKKKGISSFFEDKDEVTEGVAVEWCKNQDKL